MNRTLKIKSILLSTGLTIGLSALMAVNAYAYTPGMAAYQTVSGDSLYKISRVFHTTVGSLMDFNHLKGYALNIGQQLQVPGDTYTVKTGDTMFLIAKKYGIPLTELQRANNLYGDSLEIGRVLAVPMAATAGTAQPTPAPPSAPTVPTPAPAPIPAPTTTPAPAPASYSNADLDLMSRLICAEAQGESYQAKVAIGAVVMNRIKSGLFSDTVKGVIYQQINGYYQFTPVVNGWIDKPADEDSLKAAKEALNGSDPTNGALWYYDDSCTNAFMLAKKVAVKIDHMVFAY
jgi:LysM repeat protein